MTRRYGPFDVVCYAMALFFIYAAVMQYNDPDPYLWIPIYGSACALAVLYVLRMRIAVFAIVYCVVITTFALTYVPEVVSKQLHLFEAEQGREMLGLFIAAAWAGTIFLKARRL